MVYPEKTTVFPSMLGIWPLGHLPCIIQMGWLSQSVCVCVCVYVLGLWLGSE